MYLGYIRHNGQCFLNGYSCDRGIIVTPKLNFDFYIRKMMNYSPFYAFSRSSVVS